MKQCKNQSIWISCKGHGNVFKSNLQARTWVNGGRAWRDAMKFRIFSPISSPSPSPSCTVTIIISITILHCDHHYHHTHPAPSPSLSPSPSCTVTIITTITITILHRHHQAPSLYIYRHRHRHYIAFGSFASLFIALCSSSDVAVYLTSEFLGLASCLHSLGIHLHRL